MNLSKLINFYFPLNFQLICYSWINSPLCNWLRCNRFNKVYVLQICTIIIVIFGLRSVFHTCMKSDCFYDRLPIIFVFSWLCWLLLFQFFLYYFHFQPQIFNICKISNSLSFLLDHQTIIILYSLLVINRNLLLRFSAKNILSSLTWCIHHLCIISR